MSHDPGNTAKASECSAPAIPDMYAENNSISELGVHQPMAVGRKQLPPIVPGGALNFVGEKQYDAILRLRERRAGANIGRERRLCKVKKHKHRPRGYKGRFVSTKGNQGIGAGSMMPSIPAIRDCYLRFIATIGNQDVATGGNEVQSSTPAVDFYLPFVATNVGEENIGVAAYGSEAIGGHAYWPVAASEFMENVGVAAYSSGVPSSYPTSDFYWPIVATSEEGENVAEAATAYGNDAADSYPTGEFSWPVVATNEDEENVGEVAYDSILNLESPDFTALLRIMLGDMLSPEVSEQFKNVARLQAPDFATLLTVMNNAGYKEALDEGHYDVEKVMLKLEGW